MSKQKAFSFALYRLIIKHESMSLFPRRINNNEDILEVLSESSNPAYDSTVSTKQRTYLWHVRDCKLISPEDFEADTFSIYDVSQLRNESIVVLKLARSLQFERSSIVTNTSITKGTSVGSPPPAIPILMFFFLHRHVVAVEYSGELLNSNRWRNEVQNIFLSAATTLGFSSKIIVEPIPSQEDVMETFNSFDRLKRLKVHLLLPNPDLQRPYKRLFDELKSGKIRELIQDIRNPDGISTKEGELPHNAASMAQAGYKEGPVEMTGDIKNKKNVHIRTGETAIRAKISIQKEQVHEMQFLVSSQETKSVLLQINEEIEDLLGSSETCET